VFIREKKILIYIYIYTSAYTHIQQTRSNALSSLSLALAPRIVCRSDGRRRRPPSALSFILFSPSSFLSFFFFFPDKFRVFKSHALSRHVFSLGLAGRPILLYFSRATRTHNTHTQTKKCNPWSPKEPPRSRAPREWRDRWERREIQIYLFLLAYEFLPRVWISPIFFSLFSLLSLVRVCGGKSICALLPFLFRGEEEEEEGRGLERLLGDDSCLFPFLSFVLSLSLSKKKERKVYRRRNPKSGLLVSSEREG